MRYRRNLYTVEKCI